MFCRRLVKEESLSGSTKKSSRKLQKETRCGEPFALPGTNILLVVQRSGDHQLIWRIYYYLHGFVDVRWLAGFLSSTVALENRPSVPRRFHLPTIHFSGAENCEFQGEYLPWSAEIIQKMRYLGGGNSFFFFSPLFGEDEPILTSIFFNMGGKKPPTIVIGIQIHMDFLHFHILRLGADLPFLSQYLCFNHCWDREIHGGLPAACRWQYYWAKGRVSVEGVWFKSAVWSNIHSGKLTWRLKITIFFQMSIFHCYVSLLKGT